MCFCDAQHIGGLSVHARASPKLLATVREVVGESERLADALVLCISQCLVIDTLFMRLHRSMKSYPSLDAADLETLTNYIGSDPPMTRRAPCNPGHTAKLQDQQRTR